MRAEIAAVLLLLLPAWAVAQGALTDAQRAQWRDYRPELPAGAVKRVTDRLPLSDQRNVGRWVKYAPMSDEFAGRRLDAAKWFPTNPTWKGRQPGWFDPDNVVERAGSLQLTMRKAEPAGMPKAEGYHTYTSAAVQSKGTVLYGYFEVRARAMASGGSSAFWFYKGDADRWTEIDVFEIGARAAGFERKVHITVHVFRTPELKEHWAVGSHWLAPFDLAGGYHVYGLEWDAERLRFYVDGALVREGPNTHWHQPLTMNFDSETMPEWFGLPKDDDLPSTFAIDYVRAWKHAGEQP